MSHASKPGIIKTWLDCENLPLFQKIGDELNNEKGHIAIEGYTDTTALSAWAPFSSNDALSLARAQTVAGVIEKRLIDANRVGAEGLGESRPIAPNDSPGGKARNRRVIRRRTDWSR